MSAKSFSTGPFSTAIRKGRGPGRAFGIVLAESRPDGSERNTAIVLDNGRRALRDGDPLLWSSVIRWCTETGGFARLEPDGRDTTLADRYQGRRLNSPNDLVFKSDGSIYFTDPLFGLPGAFDDAEKELPFQGVYRLSPEGTLTLLTRELKAPNGIGFSPDEKTL